MYLIRFAVFAIQWFKISLLCMFIFFIHIRMPSICMIFFSTSSINYLYQMWIDYDTLNNNGLFLFASNDMEVDIRWIYLNLNKWSNIIKFHKKIHIFRRNMFIKMKYWSSSYVELSEIITHHFHLIKFWILTYDDRIVYRSPIDTVSLHVELSYCIPFWWFINAFYINSSINIPISYFMFLLLQYIYLILINHFLLVRWSDLEYF